MSTSGLEYAQHILDEARYLIERTSGVSKATFLQDETLKRACVRSLEVIGEAATRLPAGIKQQYPQVEWRAIAGMRDRLIHGYFGIDYDIVWDAIVEKVPELAETVERIIQQAGSR